jgi:hypothetical protein
MNIWALRKKLKNATNKPEESTAEAAPSPVRQPLQQQFVQQQPIVPALPTLPPAPVAPLPDNIGLNDLFEMDDSEIRGISPKLTFSGFKIAKPVEPATTLGTTTSRMKKPSLESLKQVHEEMQQEKQKGTAETKRTNSEKAIGLNDLLTMDF